MNPGHAHVQVVRVHGRNFGPIGTPVQAHYTLGAVATSAINSITNASAALGLTGILRGVCICKPPRISNVRLPFMLAADDALMYGLDGAVVMFPALSCVVSEAHTIINCSTAPGAGAGLSWVVTVGGQVSQAPVTSYAGPQITLAVMLAG